MPDAFRLTRREFNRRLRGIGRLERWRRGDDDTTEGRVAAGLQQFMERAARGLA